MKLTKEQKEEAKKGEEEWRFCKVSKSLLLFARDLHELIDRQPVPVGLIIGALDHEIFRLNSEAREMAKAVVVKKMMEDNP